MLKYIRQQLLIMRARDEDVRGELAADGSLFNGYHSRMEEVHRANSHALRAIIDEHGWPDERLVGSDGAEAAWLVVQHSIAEPNFMHLCRRQIDEASCAGFVPRWQYAYIDDRIQVFEGKAQRFGTQIDLKPEGAVVHELEDPAQVDAWRQEVGLGPIAAVITKAKNASLPSMEEYKAKQAEALLWRRRVGWIK
jgi:hypothetical protein